MIQGLMQQALQSLQVIFQGAILDNHGVYKCIMIIAFQGMSSRNQIISDRHDHS